MNSMQLSQSKDTQIIAAEQAPTTTIRKECINETTSCQSFVESEDLSMESSSHCCYDELVVTPPTSPVAPVPICSWAHVKIKERIGNGSFAMVMRAKYYYDKDGVCGGCDHPNKDYHGDKNSSNNNKRKVVVALKCLRTGEFIDSKSRGYAHEGLRNEAQILSKLSNHPHIVSLMATSSLRGSPFFLMELLQKETLEDKINEWGRLVKERKAIQEEEKRRLQTAASTTSRRRRRSSSAWWTRLKLIGRNSKGRNSSIDDVPSLYDRMFHIGYRISQAIAYLHSKQILHYDIKPSNIGFDSSSGKVKIFDFGLSEDLSLRNPKDGFQTGSFRYMAPEVMTGQNDHSDDDINLLLSPDIYSFAITLWEIVSLEKSQKHINDVETIIDLVANKGGRPSLEGIDNVLLKDMLDSCWNRDPTKRPTIKNLVSTLSEIVSEMKQEYSNTPSNVATEVENSVVDLHVLDGLRSEHGKVNGGRQESSSRSRNQTVKKDESSRAINIDDRCFNAVSSRRKRLFGTEKTVSTISVNTVEELGCFD